MTLAPFLRRYKQTGDVGNRTVPASLNRRVDEDFLHCIEELGGKTFNHGLYRVYRGDQIRRYTELVSRLFRGAAGQIVVFASDWSGRQFAIDFAELHRGRPTVGCFDCGGPDGFCTDQPIVQFHNKALVKQANAALAERMYRTWKKGHKEPIPPDKCVGYKVPLFLGGKDKVSNLELTDMEVYLETCLQLWEQVRNLPDGTPVSGILPEREQ
jgi:hypothetical protein